MRRGPKPAKSKEAKPPVAPKSPKNDARVRDLEKRLAESLEREKAAGQILRVISSSPASVQPTFEAIAESATRLCGAVNGLVFRFDGELIHVAAHHNIGGAELDAILSVFPLRPGRSSIAGRAIESRRIVHVDDLAQDPEYEQTRVVQAGFRTALSVPMLRGGVPIGTINVMRMAVAPFSPSEISLLQTFADQAVIAIENVRLFNELEARNYALTESLDQQTGTSEILRVISSSPTDTQPVFEVIAANAARLCVARDAQVLRVEGDVLRLVSAYGSPSMPPIRAISRGHAVGRAVIDRETIHVRDMAQAVAEFPETSSPQHGVESLVAVPLLREGVAIGVIRVSRTQIQPFTDQQITLLQTFASQAVIAIENVRLFTELQASNRDLTTALDKQTATSEILRAIAQTPTDTQPVFDTIVRSAAALCHAVVAGLFLTDGQTVSVPANYGSSPEALGAVRALFPRPLDTESSGGIAILTKSVVHMPDIEEPSVGEMMRQNGRRLGFRSLATVPMLRGGEAVGAIGVYRREPGRFSDAEVTLLQTFADQAVIAIENVRLFKELQEKNSALTTAHAQVSEALEQQTATSEILRVIAASPTDVQPVFDTIVESAARLCHARFCHVLRFDGALLHLAAHHGMSPEAVAALQSVYPLAPGRGSAAGRSILSGRIEQIPDTNADADFRHSRSAAIIGAQSVVAVPMLRDGMPIGSIVAGQSNTGVLPERLVTLLQTFADQAVIAIENVRLFNETKEALERQTATAEILGVISRSPTDVQPVFEAICQSAVRLFDAYAGAIVRFDGQLMHFGAVLSPSVEADERYRRLFPRSLDPELATGQAILGRTIVHISDLELENTEANRALGRGFGYRRLLVVPMMRDGVAIGALAVTGREPGRYSDRQIGLLQTFANQAVIAIENVRLFTELEARTQDLTRSVGQLTALGEVGRAVSSTLDLETVLSTIVSRAIELSATDGGSVYEYDEATEEFSLRACRDLPEDYVEQVRDARPRKGEGAVGRVAQTREPVQIADISDPAAYESRVRNTLLQMGLRALLAVPLIAEDQLVGALIVMRKRTGTFGGGSAAPDFCHPICPGHPERPTLPGNRGQEPPARSRQPAQVRVSGQHVPRAAHASQRHHRVLGSAVGEDVRRAQREAGRVLKGHSRFRPASLVPDQRHPRPVENRSGADGAGAIRLPSPHGTRRRPDLGPRAGRAAINRTSHEHRYPAGPDSGGRAEGPAGGLEPAVECHQVHA
jgi:GAF domain-containing protein